MFTEEGNRRVKILIWQALTKELDQLAEDVYKFELIEYDDPDHTNEAKENPLPDHMKEQNNQNRFRWLYFKLDYLAKQTRFEEANDREVKGIAGGTLATMLMKNGMKCFGWELINV